MAGHVYAIASGKGGVGKTTTVVNLGVVLRRADHSVALVDADLGMANLAPMVGVSGDRTLHEVLAGDATLDEALVEEAPGFAVLPGSEELRAYADADPGNLRAVLETLAASYDFVLVDTGAGMSHEDVLPLGLADRVVLVASPDPAAIGDTRKTAELADLAAGQIAGLVVTKTDADTDVKEVASQVDVELLGVIPFDPTVRRSTASGRPLEAVDPETPAAGAYRELAERLVAAAPEPSAGEEAVAEPGAEGEPTAPATGPAPSPESTDEAEAGAAAGGSTEPPGDAAEAVPDATEPAPEITDEVAEPASTEAEGPPADPVDDAVTATTGDEPDAPDVGADEATESTVEDAEGAEEEGAEAEAATESEGEDEPAEVEAAAEDEEALEEAEASAGGEDEGAKAEATAGSGDEGTEAEAAEGNDEPEAAAEEDDYLAEFEDDEPDSKGGFLSRIGRLFRL